MSGTLLAIAAAAILQRLSGVFPRPPLLFILTGIAATATAALIIARPPTTDRGYVPIYALILLQAFFIRASGTLGLAASGRDTFMWASSSLSWAEAGGIVGGGMYSESPLFILELVVGRLILDSVPYEISIYAAGGITIIYASILPLILSSITIQITGSRRDGALAALLGAFFPLFLRASTILEAEHAALVWFGCTILLLSRVYQSPHENRWQMLLLGDLLAVNLLHFFYGGMTIGITLLTVFAGAVLSRGFGQQSIRHWEIIGLTAVPATVYLFYHQIFSSWGYQTVGILISMTDITLPSSPLELFIPSSGASVESVGGGGGGEKSGFVGAVTKWLPLMISFTIAAIGGLKTLRRRQINPVIHGSAIIVGGVTIALLVASLGYNLHFRLYYFVSIYVCIFAAIGLVTLSEIGFSWNVQPTVQIATRIAGIVLILSFMITAPITPLGNNFDPNFSSHSWSVTKEDYSQLEPTIDFGGSRGMVSDEDSASSVLRAASSETSDSELVLRQGKCNNTESKIMATKWAVCN